MGRKKADASLTQDPIQEALLKAPMRTMRCSKEDPKEKNSGGNIHRLGFLCDDVFSCPSCNISSV